MRIAISSGHGKYISGAVGYVKEHDEAVKVVNRVYDLLIAKGVEAWKFEDTTSHTQNDNLATIVNWHNSKTRDLDVSIHFNSDGTVDSPLGTECLYVTQKELASKVASAISFAGGLVNRGSVYRSGLYFLNHTTAPAILIETCFVTSQADVNMYHQHFEEICGAIADTIAGESVPETAAFHVTGRCSWFGGPNDTGVSSSEGLAFIYSYDQRPDLFLDQQPPGTTGLARRLNPSVFYVACRWDYDVTPKTMLDDVDKKALVRANNREFTAWPADWGPNSNTGRVADLSKGLMDALGIETDDTVEVIYPHEEPVVTLPKVKIETEGKVEVWLNGVLMS